VVATSPIRSREETPIPAFAHAAIRNLG
jgi:hypothetical protein